MNEDIRKELRKRGLRDICVIFLRIAIASEMTKIPH